MLTPGQNTMHVVRSPSTMLPHEQQAAPTVLQWTSAVKASCLVFARRIFTAFATNYCSQSGKVMHNLSN